MSLRSWRTLPLFPVFCIGLAVFAVGLGLGKSTLPGSGNSSLVRQVFGDSGLVAEPLYLEVPESDAFPRYQALSNEINAFAAKPPAGVTQVGIYFRDLNANQWVGANETIPFWPASLSKVATMIAVYKEEETDPGFAYQQFNYVPSTTTPTQVQDYQPPVDPATPDVPYPVDDLMTRMIEESDDNSNAALVTAVGIDAVAKVFDDLSVTKATDPAVGGDDAQEYSRFFRVLYNGSYLTPADSESALTLLSHATYTLGLVAGVPQGVTVAHKFGEYTDNPTGTIEHQLHDCGIIYYPGHPYFLCVMTRGTDFNAQANAIKQVSTLAWDAVNAAYGATTTP